MALGLIYGGQRMKRFRFGVINESFGSPGELAERAIRAEELGFDTFLIRDHLAPDYFGPQYAPLVTLGWLAAKTTTLRLGTLVIDNDFRHPAILAKEINSLDQLSGGRIELGLGAGWLKTDYASAGIQYDDNKVRIDRLEEALPILRSLLKGDAATHAGSHYTVDQHVTYPAPVQKAGPPLLIGAGKPRMLQLAGQYADIVGLLTTSVSSGAVEDAIEPRLTQAVRDRVALVREGAGDRFHDIELQIVPSHYPAATIEKAAEMAIADHGWDGIDGGTVMDMPAVLLGPTDAVVEQMLARREDLGISYYVVDDAMMDSFAPVVAALSGT
jgi:probable F420-dependent oxidoreductase